VGAIAIVAARVTQGHMPVHDLVLTVVLAGQVMSSLQAATSNANWVAWTFTAVRRYVWLIDYAAAHARDEAVTEPPATLRHGISFEGVAFRYADRPSDALSEVDLFLPAGSTVAIVGDNGAGKTTLIKLLGRYYEPTGGRITIDGVDLSSLDVEAWRRRMTAAFQDHARLELRAGDAIGAGDLDRLNDPGAPFEALERAGASDLLHALSDGMATQLGPEWPGGIDLSGGEWQKVALGRGMMRERPLLLLLDEPTAALDAETEHRLFERYASAAEEAAQAVGTITVLVSHRFSTVRMADLIVVLQGGRIVETGSHGELVEAGGLYAELFGMQARARWRGAPACGRWCRG
ncbi:MAG: ABC transporter ATP-binding protein, partial [Acidimicrobiales bacterium]